MSKSKKSSGSSSPPAAATPEPQSEKVFINGREVSSRIYDPSQKLYTDNTWLTPDEQRAMDTGTAEFADLIGQVRDNVAVTDEERGAFANELATPQLQKLDEQYRGTLGEATNAANARGVLNSLGFADYTTKQLDKNYQEGRQSINRQANLDSYQLAGLKLDPIQQALSIFDDSIQSPTQRAMAYLDPALQGSNAANNFATQKAQLASQNYWNGRQMNQSRGGGFFSSLF